MEKYLIKYKNEWPFGLDIFKGETHLLSQCGIWYSTDAKTRKDYLEAKGIKKENQEARDRIAENEAKIEYMVSAANDKHQLLIMTKRLLEALGFLGGYNEFEKDSLMIEAQDFIKEIEGENAA